MIIPEDVSNASTDEFTGDGEVEGPGTGTSDSIPAMTIRRRVCLYS